MVRVNRGDVVLCDLDPVVGTEQAGVRPAIVVQFDRANAVSPRTIIVPLTSKIRKVLLSSHVFIPAGVAGLTLAGVALCEQIRAIDLQRVIKVMGRLDPNTMDLVSVALRTILDL
jgi:mRNA interferase MazF